MSNKKEKITQISIRISQDEIAEIDKEWRSDFNYKNRSDYVRAKIGLKKNLSLSE